MNVRDKTPPLQRHHHRFLLARVSNFRAFEYSSSSSLESAQKSRSRSFPPTPAFSPPFLATPHGRPLRSHASSSSSSSAGGVGENVGCSDIRTDLRRTAAAPAPVPVETVDALTSESSFPGRASAAAAAGTGADGGTGVGSSSSVSRTVWNDAIDPLSLPSSSSSSSLLSRPLLLYGTASATTRGGAEGITIGFGGGTGGGEWFRSALRSGVFAPVAAGDVGRGSGGRDVAR